MSIGTIASDLLKDVKAYLQGLYPNSTVIIGPKYDEGIQYPAFSIILEDMPENPTARRAWEVWYDIVILAEGIDQEAYIEHVEFAETVANQMFTQLTTVRFGRVVRFDKGFHGDEEDTGYTMWARLQIKVDKTELSG